MTMIVEDGSGIYEANSYAGLAYSQAYLQRRGRGEAWAAADRAVRESALIAATDYIDKRFGTVFLGEKQFVGIDVPGFNMLSFISEPLPNHEIVIGSVTYTFVVTAVNPQDVVIGASTVETMTNFVTALSTNTDVIGELLEPNIVIVRNRLAGEQDEITCSSSNTFSLVWDYDQLIGGLAGTEQNLEWPRLNVYTRNNTLISGIPEKLRQATVEYASRALTEKLMPDPVTGDTGQEIRRTFEKVGPIETETAYSQTVRQIFKKYPEADRLLIELTRSGGGVYR